MISLKGEGHFGGKTSHNTHQDSTSAPALWWRGNPTLRDPDFLSSYSRSPQSSSSLYPCTLSRRPHPLLSPPKLKRTYLSRPRAANAQSDTSVASPGQRSASSDENSPSSADGYRIHYLGKAFLLHWESDVTGWGAGELVFLARHKQPEEALLLKIFLVWSMAMLHIMSQKTSPS